MESTATNALDLLPLLLCGAWLTPLASFVAILFFGKHMGAHGKTAGLVATGAIGFSFLLSCIALFGVWLPEHPLSGGHGHGGEHSEEHHGEEHGDEHGDGSHAALGGSPYQLTALAGGGDGHGDHANNPAPPHINGEWYSLGEFGDLKLTIGYYIDSLTVLMFCMVTLIATCVHLYATGYMHDELHDFTDPEVTLDNGELLTRPGRYWRFFQYLSLFCFSMLGIVIAGNIAMVFVFWELVGICSYFLIGFYVERKSASTAANKAFIVNRVGDFGMLIGLMALWSSLGTFSFGDLKNAEGEVVEQGMFSQLRTEENDYKLVPTESMAVEQARLSSDSEGEEAAEGEAAEATEEDATEETDKSGQWLLFIAGVGIFCGCVGKSAQFPLHVWLPDAMEGPTPVSALVHSATMVAAGVYLVGRFFPVFSPEALLVIAYVGCITLFLAATIAITATDIKRVLAYSTVSQLGYMMLALGLGAWTAGIFHLITHAFFKGLLFMCSGSVIHAVHTNEMTEMGGLRKKMPITAYTMLVGCLAIIGAGIPLTKIGLSGYYSKDAIIEQAFSFFGENPGHSLLLVAPVIGAMITAFYMFRLWYMTFCGEPRDAHRYDHAHESPSSMTTPLLIMSFFAIAVGWPFLGLVDLLEQGRPIGTQATTQGVLLPSLVLPDEHLSHLEPIKTQAGLTAFTAAAAGLLLATVIYLWRALNPAEIKQTFTPLYRALWNKWWFDELYHVVFTLPTLALGKVIAAIDKNLIDGLIHASARGSRGVSKVVELVFDRTVIDGSVNAFARGTWDVGVWLKRIQTGSLRQYVMFIAVGTLFVYLAATVVWLS
ncbi:MAG: NADH-quinone oxidoreductase subunit L [Planctomycetota bacterium]